jgi:hypothetical protein
MVVALSVLPFTLLQWPLKRRVNGRTENTMAIKKKGKWKDRPHNSHQKEE